MTWRKIVFWFHLTVGCTAGAVVLIMSVSGVMLVYQRQITSWLDRAHRSDASGTGAQRLPVEALLAKASEHDSAAPTTIILRSDATAPAEVSFGRNRVLLVDVYSGAILGESSVRAHSFFRSMENWHRWLGASNENQAAARAITGACNLGFFLLVLTGPFLWLPKNWSWENAKARATLRGGLSGRARDFNWHLALGVWGVVPLLFIVASGVVMSYPWANDLVYRLTGSEPAARGGGPRVDGPGRGRQNAISFEGIDRVWTRAEQQVADWKSISLRLPQSGRAPENFTIDRGDGGRPDLRSQLTVDRRTGEVIKWERFSDYNSGRRLRSWLRSVHTGEAGGLAGETVAGAASAASVVLVWTGISLAIHRLLRWKKRSGAAKQQREAPAAVNS